MAVKPKLALIPSGVKASKVYSVLPSNGVGDFDFTRSGEATRINKDGLIETVGSNIPRLDYSDGGCPSLLLEPQSANLVTYSEDFSQASWTKERATITLNADISPNGDLSASRLFDTAVSNTHYIRTILGVNAVDNSRFIFAKKGTFSHIQVSEIESRAVSDGYAIFDLENGAVVQSVTFTAEIEDFGNGWYKCILKGGNYNLFDISILPSGGTGLSDNSYLGTGSDYISIWGAQLEQQSYATSYIPTDGSATTRSAETCNNAGLSSYINSSEGVLFAEIKFDGSESSIIALSSGGISNSLFIGDSLAGSIRASLSIGGVAQASLTSGDVGASTQYNKIAFKYKDNDFALWVNGIEVDTDNSGSVYAPSTLNRFDFSYVNVGNFNFKGNCKDVRVYNTVLTDQELINLTKI